ncbi:MAG: hypothetical protein WBX25_02465, partial [Rhodomicrobium sp.]
QDARSSLLRSAQLAASPLGGLTPADVPLIEAEILSEQPGPPHFSQCFSISKLGSCWPNAAPVVSTNAATAMRFNFASYR